jgi:hypothetical protein
MKKQKGIRHQHNRAQNEAKRKAVVAAKKKEQAAASFALIHQAPTAASAFGVSYCLVSEGIFDIGIGYVILGRTISPTKIATGIFLVDMYCLGVKNAYYAEPTHEQFREMIDKMTDDGNPLVDIAPECARKIVDGAIAYAKEFGFTPHADYPPVGALFGNIDAGACPTEYEFGKDGKPLYVSGPNDTPAKIRKVIRTLTAKVGEGNFDFMVEAGGL